MTEMIESLNILMVNCLKIMIDLTAATIICRDYSSVKIVSWFLSMKWRVFLYEVICVSQALPLWLAAGGFFEKVMQLVPTLEKVCRLHHLAKSLLRAC